MRPVHRTQRRILDAARAMARERRFEDIQMNDLAARAEVARATLYRYYATREDVYAALTVDWGLAFLERLTSDARQPKSARPRIRWVLRSIVEEAAREPNLIRAFLFCVLHDDAFERRGTAPIHTLLPALLAFARGGEDIVIEPRALRLLQHVLLASLVAMQRHDLDLATVVADLEAAVDLLWLAQPSDSAPRGGVRARTR